MAIYNASGQEVTVSVSTAIKSTLTVTVGSNGDYRTLNTALAALTEKYPVYTSGGVLVYVKILSGTTINEQVFCDRQDLSWITIISEDTEVPVSSVGFAIKGNAHDSRGDVQLFAAENAAKLPTIGCIFKLAAVGTGSAATVCGYWCNRGSSGVVLSGCGFDGFCDGAIANNESSITIREGIARNCTRWGIHARHNGEISARSAILTGCGTAAYADRIGDLDVREAYLDGSTRAIDCENTSRCNANGAHANNCGVVGGAAIICSHGGSVVNCNGMEIVDPLADVFYVSSGGILTAFSPSITNTNEVTLYNETANQFNRGGLIFA